MLCCRCREEPVLPGGPEAPEHGRPEHDAGEQLAYNRGLADALAQLTQQAADQQ